MSSFSKYLGLPYISVMKGFNDFLSLCVGPLEFLFQNNILNYSGFDETLELNKFTMVYNMKYTLIENIPYQQ